LHYNFTLRPNVHFSNGDPFNAYVMWFSMYRSVLMGLAPSFILTQNFWVPGAAYGNNSTFPTLQSELNTWNFFAPTASNIAIMAADNQSFRALSAYEFQLNLGFGYLGHVPYAYLLPAIVAPVGVAVDPAFVQAHGQVLAGTPNGYLGQYMLGTGAYTYSGPFSASSSTSMTFTPDPHYWGASVAAQEPWNNNLQPAQTAVETAFQPDSSIDIQNLKTGGAAAVSFVYSGPQTITDLKGNSCVSITSLPTVYGATSGSWYIYMNQSQAPFNNLSVREAVAHAINYAEIIQAAFGGYATQWVGPVPPSYPDYNPANLAPYPYNLTLAKQEMNNSPWPLSHGGYPGTLNYEYLNTPVWADVSALLVGYLAAIGIKILPVPVSLPNLYLIQLYDSTTGQCTAQAIPNKFGGPFPIGQEFYTSDYISPDDWTQNIAISTGSANQCMAGYNNATVNQLVIQAAGEPIGSSQATAEYTTMTQLMYQNYTDVWLVVPGAFSVTNIHLKGFINNPMGSALPFVMTYNTEHAG